MSDHWENLPVGHGVVVRDEPRPGSSGLREMTLRTGGILCERCASRAADVVGELPGVHEVLMQWDRDRTVIVYEARSITGFGNGTPPDGSDITAWAKRLIDLIEAEAQTRNHEKACGGDAPRLLI